MDAVIGITFMSIRTTPTSLRLLGPIIAMAMPMVVVVVVVAMAMAARPPRRTPQLLLKPRPLTQRLLPKCPLQRRLIVPQCTLSHSPLHRRLLPQRTLPHRPLHRRLLPQRTLPHHPLHRPLPHRPLDRFRVRGARSSKGLHIQDRRSLAFILHQSNDMGSSLTYYTQNNTAGACGAVHLDTEFICALGQSGSKSYLSAKLITDK